MKVFNKEERKRVEVRNLRNLHFPKRPEYEYFLHRSLPQPNDNPKTKFYSVSEKSSGAAVSWHELSPEKAIAKAKEKLYFYSKEQIKDAVNNSLEIQEKLIPKTLHDAHKALWNWLAKTGSTDKKAAPVWTDTKFAHLVNSCTKSAQCFCCRKNENCAKCPITWVGYTSHLACTAKGSLYKDWNITPNIKTRKKLAKQIANLYWEERT